MKKIVIGNWKMYPASLKEAVQLFVTIKDRARYISSVSTVICPPYPYLYQLNDLYSGKRLAVGAQDVFYEKEGSHTGAVSSDMLKASGVSYVIVGHSERRKEGERDDVISKKIRVALDAKLTPIVCIGEHSRDDSGAYLKELRTMIKGTLASVSQKELPKLLIAYEPVWAIGGSQAMTSHNIHQTKLFIQKILREKYSVATVKKTPILYGGSVSQENITEILKIGHVEGVLVGGASRSAEQFIDIIQQAHEA